MEYNPEFDQQNVTFLSKERVYDGFFKLDRYKLTHSLFEGLQPVNLWFLKGRSLDQIIEWQTHFEGRKPFNGNNI